MRVFIVNCVVSLMVIGICRAQQVPNVSGAAQQRYYHFYYDLSNNREVLKSLPFDVAKGTAGEIVLDSILRDLSLGYFHQYNDWCKDTKISLTLKCINSIQTDIRVYKIGVVEINDSNRVCMTTFFQGSLRASITYKMLALNVMQPQLLYSSPLLDGVIFLYNGSPVTGLDHMDIDGVIVPKPFYMNAMQSIGGGN